MSHDIA